jgi:hypothetical protein
MRICVYTYINFKIKKNNFIPIRALHIININDFFMFYLDLIDKHCLLRYID